METTSLLDLLKREDRICGTLQSLEYTLNQMEENRLRERLEDEREKLTGELAAVRVSIGAKLALYTQIYGDSIRNALGILTGSAENEEVSNGGN